MNMLCMGFFDTHLSSMTRVNGIQALLYTLLKELPSLIIMSDYFYNIFNGFLFLAVST